MKKILFISNTNNISTGSYRIWVNDLKQYFEECGIPSTISYGIPTSVSQYDIIICGKSDAEAAIAVKNAYPEKKVGVINLSSDRKNLPIDFVIVGSMEEMDSLSHYDNVFLYPLIERMYQDPGDYKKHEDAPVLRIGFHGHYPHLSKFCPYLDEALEDMDKTHGTLKALQQLFPMKTRKLHWLKNITKLFWTEHCAATFLMVLVKLDYSPGHWFQSIMESIHPKR